MGDGPEIILGVSDAIALINQTLDYAYPSIVVEGEVTSFKVNQGKYVFFDLKDESGTLGCFMSLFQLRMQLEDGMRVRVVAQPKVTAWGRFSLTVRDIRPVGEGSLQRAFQLLLKKLEGEGLFATERKRRLPASPKRIGVVSSTGAAGYADFIKILSERWGDIEVIVAHTQVQGMDAPARMVRALEHLNQLADPVEAIAVIRGGGSADDLAAFNDEPLVRAIAGSRAPVITGVGHEVDTTLVDLVADVRAATPSNAAQLLVPDRAELLRSVKATRRTMLGALERVEKYYRERLVVQRSALMDGVEGLVKRTDDTATALITVLRQLDPRTALKRGYSLVFLDSTPIMNRQPKIGDALQIETEHYNIQTGVVDVTKKHSK